MSLRTLVNCMYVLAVGTLLVACGDHREYHFSGKLWGKNVTFYEPCPIAQDRLGFDCSSILELEWVEVDSAGQKHNLQERYRTLKPDLKVRAMDLPKGHNVTAGAYSANCTTSADPSGCRTNFAIYQADFSDWLERIRKAKEAQSIWSF